MSAQELTAEASLLARIVSFMIENAAAVFQYPAEFLDDVRLHFRKPEAPPAASHGPSTCAANGGAGVGGDDDASSTSSTPPVKTSITFVDR